MKHYQYKAIALFFTLLLAGRAGAQETSEFRWARSFRGETCRPYNIESIYRTIWDSAGNLYMYGAAAPGSEWNGKRMLDSDTLTWQHCKMSLFVAKIDTCGNMVWCKSARGSCRQDARSTESAYNVFDMDMRNGKIYIFGELAFSPDYEWRRDSAWLFFFDTLYKGIIDYSTPSYYDVHGYPFEASEVKTNPSYWHFFAVFDMEGNLIDRHSFYLSQSHGTSPNYLGNVAGSESINVGHFRIDSEGNVCMFTNISHPIEWDSVVRPYMVVAEDTTGTHIPLFPSEYRGPMQTLFLKFDTNWNLIETKPLMEYSYGNHVRGPGGIVPTSMDIDEDNDIYLSGYAGDFKSRRSYPQDSFPTYLYMDSAHSLKLEGKLMQKDNTPFMAKYDSNGNLLWLTQAAYTDWTIDSTMYRINPGKCHHDATAVYTTLTAFPGINNNVYPDEPDMHLFYFDSAHTDTFPDLRRQNGGSTFYFVDQLLAFDKETGELTRHWLLDSVSSESASRSIEQCHAVQALPWDNSVATVKFSRVEYGAFDLVKVNLDNDSVTQGQRIWWSGGNVNVHPEGWVLRESQVVAGEGGPEWMFTGSDTVVSGNHIVSLYYDSTLDLRRRYRCPAPTGLTVTRTTDSTALLTWEATEGNALWVVSHGPEGTPPEEGTVDTVAGVPEITLTGLDGNMRYNVFVKAVCEYTPQRFPGYQGSYPSRPPLSHWAGPEGVDTLTHTGINPVEDAEALFTLSPNPATGRVVVVVGHTPQSLRDSSPNLGEQLITIRDAAGHEVLRQAAPAGQKTIELDLSGLPAGTYFVTLTTKDRSATRRLVLK